MKYFAPSNFYCTKKGFNNIHHWKKKNNQSHNIFTPLEEKYYHKLNKTKYVMFLSNACYVVVMITCFKLLMLINFLVYVAQI